MNTPPPAHDPDAPSPGTVRCQRCNSLLATAPDGTPELCRVCMLDMVIDDDRDASHAPFGRDGEDSFGHFALEEEIGRGGMSIVYRAREYASDRLVALKMLQLLHLRTPDMLRRFEAEVRAIANLDHPNITPLYEVGQYNGIPFFSMKLAERGSLAKNTDAYRGDTRAIATLVAKVARAVFYANQRGIIHRDLKPGNILLGADDEPYIADFGISKILDQGIDAIPHTAAVGTPNYLAPELASSTSGEVTIAVDIYGLGAILYELLAHRPPAVGATAFEVIDNLAKGPPPSPRSLGRAVPRDLDNICMKCLARDPADRYANALELAEDLEAWLAGRPVRASSVGPFGQFVRFCRRQPLVAAFGLGTMLLLATIAFVSSKAAVNIAAQRDRALYAEENAQNELFNSLLIQSQLGRQTGMAGHRFKGLESLRQAAQIRVSNDLRNEAAALLALTDMRVARTIPARPSQSNAISFSPGFDHYAVCTDNLEISLRRFSDNAELARFPGTGKSILSLSEFSHDGRHFASRHYDGPIRVWDARERRLAFELNNRTPRDRPYMSARFWFGCAFSHDGKTAAIELNEGGYTLHDLAAAGRETARVSLPRGPLALAFDSSGARIAVSNRSTSAAHIRDAATGAILHTFEHPARVISLAWSPDGTQLAIACLDTNVYLWNSSSGKLERTLNGHRDRVHQVAYSPDGRLLASTSVDKTIVLWDPESGTRFVTLPDHGDEPVLRFSNDGTRIVTGDFSTDPAILEIATGDDVCRTFTPAGIANMSVITAGIDFSPDSRWLVSSTRETVNLWDLEKKRLAAALHPGPETETSALFTPDGSALLVASRNTGIARYPFDTRAADNPLGKPTMLTAEKGFTMSDFGHSTRFALLTQRRNGTALLWPLDPEADKPRKFQVQAEAWDAALSPDGKILAITGAAQGDRPDMKPLHLWNAGTGEKIRVLNGGEGGLVRFTPDGRHLLASSPGNRGFKLWDAQTFEPEPDAPVFNGLFAYNLSPDGRYLCISVQREVWLYQGEHYKTPVIKLSPPGGSSQIPKMAFSHDGRQLAVHESDGIVHLWNLGNLRDALARFELDWMNPAN